MIGAKAVYERLRPLIVWLGLTELVWISYWLLSVKNTSGTFVGLVVVWILAMLAWLVLVIYAGTRGFFLKYSVRFSNLIGVAAVVTFGVARCSASFPPRGKGF